MSPAGPLRQCSRPACAEAAAVTLTYDYRRARVWLDELSEQRDPHGYDLCERHAAGLSVPRGWHVNDRRGDPALAYVLAV